MLALSNEKAYERDLPIYSNVCERDDQGISIYLEVGEIILCILLIYLDVCGSATHSLECIVGKK